MALTNCDECGKQISDKAYSCPHCGMRTLNSLNDAPLIPMGQSTRKQKSFWSGLEDLWWGPANPALICPCCQIRGQVHTKRVERKKGISGGKATGALFTGGISLIFTGLSRKERLTQARCYNCKSIWDF